MSTATLPRKTRVRRFGPESNGIVMTPEEFDRADFVEGHRYELIHGVLIVSPPPLRKERDPNEELGHWIRSYMDDHPSGGCVDATLSEDTLITGTSRRRADRVIFLGLGRLPTLDDVPAIVVEFVSEGKRSRERDYQEKLAEYQDLGVAEYWIIDRFERTLTAFRFQGGKVRKRIVRDNQTFRTPLMPGFALPLAKLLAFADRWEGE